MIYDAYYFHQLFFVCFKYDIENMFINYIYKSPEL